MSENQNILVVENETELVEYTENHFNSQILTDLENIRRGGLRSSFMSMSLSNSLSGSGSGSDCDEQLCNPVKKYKKVGMEQIQGLLQHYYCLDMDTHYSNEIDLLTTFMKGQKNIFIQSKHITQRKLNLLIFPALLFSVFITIIVPFIECNPWSGGIISGVNAMVALFVALIHYLKLESSVEVFLQLAKHFDKLETGLEMTTSKLVFIETEEDVKSIVLSKIGEVENKLIEIKGGSTILIPPEVKAVFPIISHINIFSVIKKTEIYKRNLMEQLCDVTNEIRYILYKDGFKDGLKEGFKDGLKDGLKEGLKVVSKSRVLQLYEIKDKIKQELAELRSAYGLIDSVFNKEIKLAENRGFDFLNPYFFCFYNKKNKNSRSVDHPSPVIQKYFKLIFDDG